MVGLRRAIALLILGFYVTQFAMTAWLGPDEMFACYLGLALCYGLAFLALGAEWFWARWFAIGVGNFGSLLILVLFKVGLEPIIAFFGFTHLAVAVLLLGEGMASRYEHSEATAERWNFQEESLVLMRRAVKSAGSTIPLLILYGLAPRPEAVQLTAVGLGIAGLFGLLRGRTWGLLALADGLGLFGAPPTGYLLLTPTGGPIVYGAGVALLAALALAVPAVYARTFARYLKR
jgi:hypothetical protein